MIFGKKMAWAKPEFKSKPEVDRAGEALISQNGPTDHDLRTLNYWRSIHGCPLLTTRISLSNRAKRQDQEAIISQRIKRIRAISLKLQENHATGLIMNLSKMQDIGGCRAVMRNVAKVEELVRMYESVWTVAQLVENCGE